jgi:predicted component of type VI protein secretion system
MNSAYRIRCQPVSADAVATDHVFRDLPIAIGRNPLNDFAIVDDSTVSGFHAVIESVDGQPCVRDLDSKNGVFTTERRRIPRGKPVPLANLQNAFLLGFGMRVQVEPCDEAQAPPRRGRSSGSVIGNADILSLGLDEPSPGGARPSLAKDSVGLVVPLPALSESSVAPPEPAYLSSGGSGGAESVDVSAYSLAPNSVDLEKYAEPDARDGRHTKHFAMNMDAMALQGLRELGASLVPGATLRTTGDVARLLTKLHDTLEVFCRGFVSLKDSQEQLRVSLALAETPERPAGRSASARRLADARSPAAAATALLDWRNQDFDATVVVDEAFRAAETQGPALVESALQGVRAVLAQLSPETLANECVTLPGLGWTKALAGGGSLWRTFRTKHAAMLADSQLFEVVFGREFAACYREHVARTTTPPRSRGT